MYFCMSRPIIHVLFWVLDFSAVWLKKIQSNHLECMNSFAFIQQTFWMYSNNNKEENHEDSRRKCFKWRFRGETLQCLVFHVYVVVTAWCVHPWGRWTRMRLTSSVSVSSLSSQLRLEELLGLLHVARHWERGRKTFTEMSLCLTNTLMDLTKSHSVLLTDFEVTWFVRIHAVGVAAVDVSPHCHWGVCGYIIFRWWVVCTQYCTSTEFELCASSHKCQQVNILLHSVHSENECYAACYINLQVF